MSIYQRVKDFLRMNMPHSLLQILFILSPVLLWFWVIPRSALRSRALSLREHRRTQTSILCSFTQGTLMEELGLELKEFRLKKSSKVPITKLQEIKMIKEAHVWKLINTGKNFFFFPSLTILFDLQTEGWLGFRLIPIMEQPERKWGTNTASSVTACRTRLDPQVFQILLIISYCGRFSPELAFRQGGVSVLKMHCTERKTQ